MTPDLLQRTAELIAIPSESFDEAAITAVIEAELRSRPHLSVERIGDNVVARTTLGRAVRVVLAGHTDTVPANGNAAPRVDGDVLWGVGSSDMKAGIAVMLELAARHAEPAVDVTYVFYAREEVAAVHSGLGELQELIGSSDKTLRKLRGAHMAMVFQDPLSSLNPTVQIGTQVTEVLLEHREMNKKQAEAEAIELLDRVGIPDPRRRLREYAHQLSGGMRQRALIAMALACSPRLLIADEPTTALDVTIQAQILDLMKDLKSKVGAAIILITHDLGIVAEVAERVMVMYAGRKVEEAPVRQLYRSPRHPYTQGLFGAVPKLGSSLSGEDTKLAEIPGVVPSLKERIPGCVFAGRCLLATDLCRQMAPALELKAPGHVAACHYAPIEGGALAA